MAQSRGLAWDIRRRRSSLSNPKVWSPKKLLPIKTFKPLSSDWKSSFKMGDAKIIQFNFAETAVISPRTGRMTFSRSQNPLHQHSKVTRSTLSLPVRFGPSWVFLAPPAPGNSKLELCDFPKWWVIWRKQSLLFFPFVAASFFCCYLAQVNGKKLKRYKRNRTVEISQEIA